MLLEPESELTNKAPLCAWAEGRGIGSDRIVHYIVSCLLGLLSSVSTEEFIDFNLRLVETSVHLMKEKGATKHVFIFDLQGLTLKVSGYIHTSLFDVVFIFQDVTFAPMIEILQRLITIYEGKT